MSSVTSMTPPVLPTGFRPMKAARGLDEITKDKLVYGSLLASRKLDGIRAMVLPDLSRGGSPVVVSLSLKPIRSAFVQRMFAKPEFIGLDGELIAGPPNAPDVFSRSTSAVMTIGCQDPVTFHVFDICYPFEEAKRPFRHRQDIIRNKLLRRTPFGGDVCVEALEGFELVPQHPVNSWNGVLDFESETLELGFEGVMLRSGEAPYKNNRATLREQYLMKLKRLEDSEAEIIDFVELMTNENVAVIDALGYQKRSASKEGKRGAQKLGALVVRDLKTGVEFEVGSGFDDATRQFIWDNHKDYLDKIITYRYFPVGIVDKPRHPIFKGFRHRDDM